MELQVCLGYVCRVRHIVLHRRPSQAVRTAPIVLRPTNSGVNRHVGNVDAFRHEFSRHALRQTGLAVRGDRKRPTLRVALKCCTRVGEDDGAPLAICTRCVCEHALCRLLAYEKGAVRGVLDRIEDQTWVR